MDGIRMGKFQHSTFNIQHYNKVYGFTKSLSIQHRQFIVLNGCLLILPASFLVSHTNH